MPKELDTLQLKLAYQFKDPHLIRLALTHRSASIDNNERLEFLGDALLDLIVGESLYLQHEDAQEGDLSRMRSAIVNKQALAAIGRSLGLGEHVALGSGELKSGGQTRDSILADAVEALVAAVYLDGGMEPCRQLVAGWTKESVQQPEKQREKDAKTRLQEFMQAQGASLPKYEVISTSGEAHAQTFLVQCTVTDLAPPQQGSGRSKRAAEQEAAARVLALLQEQQ